MRSRPSFHEESNDMHLPEMNFLNMSKDAKIGPTNNIVDNRSIHQTMKHEETYQVAPKSEKATSHDVCMCALFRVRRCVFLCCGCSVTGVAFVAGGW